MTIVGSTYFTGSPLKTSISSQRTVPLFKSVNMSLITVFFPPVAVTFVSKFRSLEAMLESGVTLLGKVDEVLVKYIRSNSTIQTSF